MSLVQVKDSQVVKTSLPKTGTLSDGRTVSNYDKLSFSVLLSEGWLPLEDVKPQFNYQTQTIKFSHYDILENKVVSVYTVDDKADPSPPPKPPDPPAPTEVEKLQAIVADLAEEVLLGGAE